MSDVTRSEAADKIVIRYTEMAAAVSLLPVPLWDLAAVSGMQLSMFYKLCDNFDVKFSEKKAKTIITSLVGGATSAALASGLVFSLFKFVPGIGMVVGGLTLPIASGATTYALGRVFKQHLENGGTLFDLNTARARGEFDRLKQKGKDLISKKSKSAGTVAPAGA